MNDHDVSDAAERTSDADPKEANRWAKQLHSHYELLRESEAGRRGISALLTDPSPHVRVWAAAHPLAWDPKTAQRTLEELRDARGPCSFDAEMALKEFGRGTLSFEH